MERLTSQKEFILEYLKSTKSHPTAEQIFEKVKKKLPRISLGTVYRNLDSFSKKKIIKEIPGIKKRYDADLSPHCHFFCKNCNQVFDIENTLLKLNELQLDDNSIGLIENYEIFTYGICKKCK